MGKGKKKKKKPPPKLCGSLNTNTGSPCRQVAVHRGGVCRFHRENTQVKKGPLSPKATKRPFYAASRGLYQEGLFPEEQLRYESIKIGTLEEEIKLLKVQLERAVVAQLIWLKEQALINDEIDADPDLKTLPSEMRKHVEVELFERSFGKDKDGLALDNRKLVRRKRDYMAEIKALSRIIASLEVAHKELVGDSNLTSPETVDLLGTKLAEFAAASFHMLPKVPVVKQSQPDAERKVVDDDR